MWCRAEPGASKSGTAVLVTQSSDWRRAASRVMAWSGWQGAAVCIRVVTCRVAYGSAGLEKHGSVSLRLAARDLAEHKMAWRGWHGEASRRGAMNRVEPLGMAGSGHAGKVWHGDAAPGGERLAVPGTAESGFVPFCRAHNGMAGGATRCPVRPRLALMGDELLAWRRSEGLGNAGIGMAGRAAL